MTSSLALHDILAYSLQIGLLVGAGSLVPLALRLRDPRARLLFWQFLLVTCLALPFVRPWRQQIIGVAAPLTTAVIATAQSAAGPAVATLRLPPAAEVVLWLLAAGVIVRLLLLSTGLIRLALYRGRGTDAKLPGIPSDVTVLLSAGIRGPVTFGWLRPAILLPASFLSLSGEMRQAILRHELLHIARRDWLFTLAEELIRAVLWFHPAIWWVIGEIQLAREQTVDRAVIENTGAREFYLDALLLMAGVPAGPVDLAAAPGFLRRRHLKRRLLEAMKEVRMTTISRTRLVCLLSAALTIVAATCWLATGVFPLTAAPQLSNTTATDAPGVSVNLNGTPLLHRSPITYPADALAKNIEGSVVLQIKLDGNGEVLESTALSGPDELRTAAQQSVLTWHFDKSAALTTRVINIEFSKATSATDKALFDRATAQIARRDYEGARQTLNNLINAFPASQYLFNAKLGIVESWYRGGGAYGIAQAQAEFRDLILFYPYMIDAARPLGQEIGALPRQTASISAPPPPVAGKLARIVVTGLSDSARADLLSGLPIQEGGEWSSEIFAAVTTATKAFDPHLVAALTTTPSGSLELHIGPAADFPAVFEGKTVMFRNAATTVPNAPASPAEPLRVGNGVTPPSVLYRVDPELPSDATHGTAEMVMLACVVDTNGKPVEIRVVKSGGQALDEKAIEAVTKWVFNPGMQNGVPVKVRATVEVHFRQS